MTTIELSDIEKINMLDRIINVVPEIKKKRKFIISQLLAQKNIQQPDEYILERICVNNKYYYRDKYKAIFNENAELVGVWEWCVGKNKFNYYIFQDEETKILDRS